MICLFKFLLSGTTNKLILLYWILFFFIIVLVGFTSLHCE